MKQNDSNGMAKCPDTPKQGCPDLPSFHWLISKNRETVLIIVHLHKHCMTVDIIQRVADDLFILTCMINTVIRNAVFSFYKGIVSRPKDSLFRICYQNRISLLLSCARIQKILIFINAEHSHAVTCPCRACRIGEKDPAVML